jgi:predicted CopG family antitoxin
MVHGREEGVSSGKVTWLEGVVIPRVCFERLEEVRVRISKIIEKYGSLQRYGRPVWQDVMEVACVVYLNERLNVSLEKLSYYLGFSDKTALYKYVRRIRETSTFTLWDGRNLVIERMSLEELIKLVEKEIQARTEVSVTNVRTITVTLEAYETLLMLKRPGETFSDVILRLAREAKDVMELAGAWKDVPGEKIEEVMKSIREAWSSWRLREE